MKEKITQAIISAFNGAQNDGVFSAENIDLCNMIRLDTNHKEYYTHFNSTESGANNSKVL